MPSALCPPFIIVCNKVLIKIKKLRLTLVKLRQPRCRNHTQEVEVEIRLAKIKLLGVFGHLTLRECYGA